MESGNKVGTTGNRIENIRLMAYKNEHLDEGSQWTIADRLLWYEYRELYQQFRGGLIDQKQAEAEKNRIMQRYDTALAVQEMSDRVFQAQSDLWKRIEPTADRYRLNRTVENADAFIEAVYSVKSKNN